MQWMDCLANFGPLQLDFNCMKPCHGKTVDLGGVFRPFGGSDGDPWGHGWGPWPPGTWMRPEDAVDGLSGEFWAPMT